MTDGQIAMCCAMAFVILGVALGAVALHIILIVKICHYSLDWLDVIHILLVDVFLLLMLRRFRRANPCK
jgi:hypothetical protein